MKRLTALLIAPFVCLVALSCNFFMEDLTPGTANDDTADASVDAGGPPCPGYISGSDIDECCTVDNICGWEEDGSCDCGGNCDWDSADCGT